MKKGSVIMTRLACRSIFKIVFGEKISNSPNIADIIPIINMYNISLSKWVSNWNNLPIKPVNIMVLIEKTIENITKK